MVQNRRHSLPQSQTKGHRSQQQTPHLGHADIPAADAEGQLCPRCQKAHRKQSVAEDRKSGPKGAEQFIRRPQTQPHQHRGSKLSGGYGHRRHLNRRLAQPPRCRGSS